jgi:hypothetical protein
MQATPSAESWAAFRRVAGWLDQDRRGRRQQYGGCEIIRAATGHSRHEIGGGWRDHDESGVARQPDVADLSFIVEVEQRGEDALARYRADR